jgi:hypothetical protein
MGYFDYEAAAREAHLTDEQLRQVTEAVRWDYPHDEMLFELHVLRTCWAIRDGVVSLAEMVRPEAHGA